MRCGLFAVAALLFASPALLAADPPVVQARPVGVGAGAAEPALPPIVFQAHPLGRVLDELRMTADIIGGEKAVKAVNKGLKEIFGDKGLDGLDLGRPIVGYVVLAPKPEDITAVIALPVTGEKEFLDLCERANRQKPKLAEKEKDVYELPPLDPRYKALMRFKDGYAYIAYGAKPAPHLDPRSLVPMAKIYDPAERGIIAGRVYFDRIPLPVKLAAPVLFEEVKKTVFGTIRLNREEWLTKAITPEMEKLVTRYAKLAGGADVLAARLFIDPAAGNIVVEATLNGKPDSELSKLIAAWKQTPNKFAALLNAPDTVAGFKVRAPLFEEEIRAATVAVLEAAEKEETRTARDVEKAVMGELFKGLARTVKTGEFDAAVAVRGPDKNGWYTGVGAVAFEDPAGLEKEFKTFVQKDAPPDFRENVKWDADKAGNVNIHTWKIKGGGFLDFTKVFGGEDCTVAFAFAPHGVFGAIGPDAVNTLKDALAVKPAPAPVLEAVANPARLAKLIHKIAGENRPDPEIDDILGNEDKLRTALSITLEGGKELKGTITVNLRLIPRAMMYGFIGRADKAPARPEAVPVEKK